MKRWAIVLAATLAMLGLPACGEGDDASDASPAGSSDPTWASTNGSDGRICSNGTTLPSTVPSPTPLTPTAATLNSSTPMETRRWLGGHRTTPQIQVFCCGDGNAAHLIDANTGKMQTLAPPDPDLETFCGGAWSPDGERLACEVYGVDDPSLTGIYSIRVSDGEGLTRITSNPSGYDVPGDYSPDGTRLVFARFESEEHARLFITDVEGSGVRKVSGRIVGDLSPGRWAPTGDQILFAGRRSPDHHKTIWIVDADGLAARAADRRSVRWPLVGPRGRGVLLAGVVAGRHEDRVRAVDPRGRGRRHLHRECRREWFGPGDGR